MCVVLVPHQNGVGLRLASSAKIRFKKMLSARSLCWLVCQRSFELFAGSSINSLSYVPIFRSF